VSCTVAHVVLLEEFCVADDGRGVGRERERWGDGEVGGTGWQKSRMGGCKGCIEGNVERMVVWVGEKDEGSGGGGIRGGGGTIGTGITPQLIEC
jgi:hypothetical protein